MISTNVKKLAVVILGAFIYSIGMNFFLVPADVYASGFSGLAQLLMRIIYDYFHIKISMGVFLLLLNIPVVILGWMKIGKSFTLYSFISVGFMSLFLRLTPIHPLSDDIFLNAVFGGLINAIGIGITLRWGASTGGMDIIALVLSRIWDKPVGQYSLFLNSFIIIAAGYLYGSEKSLYTLVALYTSSRMIDTIHTQSKKLTALIITNKTKEMKIEIFKRLTRGVTIVPARGAFSDENKEMLLTVITQYELFELKQIVKKVDPHAFTDIIQTEQVLGRFVRRN